MATQQLTKLRLPNGTEVAFVDWSDQPLWSSAYMRNGFTDHEVPFFTYAAGEPVTATSNIVAAPVATLLDTNISVAGTFQASEEMLVYAIKPEFFFMILNQPSLPITSANVTYPNVGGPNPTLSQLKRLFQQLALRLWVSEKVAFEAPLGYFNAGFGPEGQGVAANVVSGNTSVRSFANNGSPGQYAVRSFALPIHIGGTEKYRVTFTNEIGINGGTVGWADDNGDLSINLCYARVILDGLYKRPVS
jgi:hypothetical protein